MPFDIPGMEINIPHDQYSIVAELSQQIWDGGAGALRKEAAIVGARVKSSQLEVNLYAIRSRVRNVFLGIILLDKQIAINELLEQNLQRQLDEMQALLENSRSGEKTEVIAERVEEKNPLEHFVDFFTAQNNGQSPSERQMQIMRQIIEEAEVKIGASH